MCHQWHNCVHSPDICGEVEANGFHSSAAFDSLACWLRRHGQHVRSLRLLARGYHVFNAPTMAEAEETLLLGCCLAACAPAGQLQRLRIESGSVPVLAAWVQPLRSLRELSLLARSEDVIIKCSLEHCTQLTELCLEGDEVVFADGVRLPPSLRRMRLVDECSAALPAQVGPCSHCLATSTASLTAVACCCVSLAVWRFRSLATSAAKAALLCLEGCLAGGLCCMLQCCVVHLSADSTHTG